MRCPKCGFISFDHLETCLKCKKDIKSISENIHGSVYNVEAPLFLKFNTEPEVAEVELDEAFVDDGDVFSDEEIRDPDLDILMNDEAESEEDAFELELGEEDSGAVVAEEDQGIGFQLEEFAEDADFSDADEIAEAAPEKSVRIELPDELSDISDLEQPPVPKQTEDETLPERNDLNLDFDLDLNLDGEEPAAAEGKAKNVDLADLELQDLDFKLEEDSPVPKKHAGKKLDLDDDLDFELDLGDLKLDDE